MQCPACGDEMKSLDEVCPRCYWKPAGHQASPRGGMPLWAKTLIALIVGGILFMFLFGVIGSIVLQNFMSRKLVQPMHQMVDYTTESPKGPPKKPNGAPKK